MSESREPLHRRVADLLERAFNPIMLRELRGSLRGTRFFVSHLVILCLFAAGLMLAFIAMIPSRGGYDVHNDPSLVGRRVYIITQLLQLGIAFLVVPGLAATSISAEREMLTYDLLLTTTMTAREVVWGKFTAAMTQAFTIFVSMLPLVGLCFLFGGITVYQILANYAFLFALSAVMVAYALSMSATAKTTQRAVGSVYGLTLVGGGAGWILLAALWDSRWSSAVAVAYGFLPPVEAGRHGGLDSVDRVLYVHLLPGFVWAALTSLFFLNAINRLKPLYANRSTPLRIYFLALLFGAGAVVAVCLHHSLPAASPADDRSVAMMTYATIALTIGLLGSLFACEEPFLPRDFVPGPKRNFFLGLLQPGSNSGAAFTILSIGVFLALSMGAFLPFTTEFSRGAWASARDWMPLVIAFTAAFSWTFFTATFARWLAALMPGRPMLLRTILMLTCLFLALFPLVHWAVALAIDRDVFDDDRRHGPVTLALSPVMAVFSSLDLRPGRRDFPMYAGSGRLPVPAAFIAFSLGAGAVFVALGNRARARLKAEWLASGETPPGP